MDYSQKLKDPRWQKKRLEILERDGWKCMACGDKEKTLHVHHIFYLPGKEPWDIPSCEGGPCSKCKDYSLDKNNTSRCEGPGDDPADLVFIIGSILDQVWSNPGIYGGGDYKTMLCNLLYMMKG
jgi:hypothetical protein